MDSHTFAECVLRARAAEPGYFLALSSRGWLQLRLCQTALVVDGHGGAINDGALDIIDADVIAEHSTSIGVAFSIGVPVKAMKEAFGNASRM